MKNPTKYFVALLLASATFGVAMAQTNQQVDVKKAKISRNDFAKIKRILASAKQGSYRVAYLENGKTVQRLGSASFQNISTVKGYSAAGGGKAADEILTTVSSYVKTIWTAGFAQMYPEKVRQINQILEQRVIAE
jgi:hypothetical protein